MRPWLVLLAVLALFGSVAVSEDVEFRDGRVWTGARVHVRDVHLVVVSYNKGIHTIHAVDLRPDCAERLGLRELTPEEIAERDAAEARQRAAEFAAARAVAAPAPVAPVTPPAPTAGGAPVLQQKGDVVIIDPEGQQTIIRDRLPPARVHLSGRVIEKINEGVFVYAEGASGMGPVSASSRRAEWMTGPQFIYASIQLMGVTRDSQVTGHLYRAGTFSYRGKVYPAWSYEPRL